MAAGQQIDYEALAQEAMRGVVRAVLTKVAASGLIGEHHFYIAFNTHGAGVSISKRLKEKYPEEMTIVLQHRFSGLEVADDRFEVTLTFDGIPERLVIPFKSVKVFYDPSVPYGLQFEESELMTHAGRRGPARPRDGEAAEDASPLTVRAEKRAGRAPRKARPSDLKPAVADVATAAPDGKLQKPARSMTVTTPEGPAAGGPAVAAKPANTEVADPAASKVVDFSKFRNSKK